MKFDASRYSLYILILVLANMLTTGCLFIKPQPDSAQLGVPVVQVIPSGNPPEKRILSSETIPQNNCGGSAEVSSTIERSRSIAYILEIGGEIKIDADGSVGVPDIGEIQVGAEVAAKYGVTYGQEETFTRSLTVSAKEGTNIQHELKQVEYWEIGELVFTSAEKTMRYPYSFRRDFGVELVKSENIDCSASMPVPQTIFSPTPVPDPTPIHTTEPFVLPTVEPTSAPSSTRVIGEYKALGESYEAGGISLTLTNYNIKSDGTIWLEFAVTNQGNSKILLRYQDNYFSVKDDTGRIYQQDEDFLLDSKQVELSPGNTFKISGHSWPDGYDQVGIFYGKVPEQANNLIVRVSQFADLRDMQWLIPLNAQLSKPQAPAPGTQQPLLEGFIANGIAVLFSDYSIKSDGTIDLEFLVRNEGNNAVLLRYQDKYFEVYDDLGNKYDQDEDFLLEPKQALLLPGGSFKISGHSWPDGYDQVGIFYGKVPEQANNLIVRVSQFADLRDMQWLIPLNAQLSKPQAPAPGTQQPLLEGFIANGIAVLFSDYSIKSDGTIDLEFLVRNEGNNAVLLRYQDKYFEVYDDLGNKYDQDEDFLLEPKQALLLPGGSFKISGHSWPDGYDQVGIFYGNIPEQANNLIVRVSQFAGLRDMQWLIPLN